MDGGMDSHVELKTGFTTAMHEAIRIMNQVLIKP
jgi:hypothetical protein